MSKTNGTDTCTFTYSSELKVETVRLNGQELHHFAYDANGQSVSERRSDGTLVYFVGEYYEYSVRGRRRTKGSITAKIASGCRRTGWGSGGLSFDEPRSCRARFRKHDGEILTDGLETRFQKSLWRG